MSSVIPASKLLTSARPQWLDQWAFFARQFQLADAGKSCVRHAKEVMLDTIGVIAAGMQEKEPAVLGGMMPLASGETGATLIGLGRSAEISRAAFLNGTAGCMLELDEGNQFARGHPAIHVVPAILALGEARGLAGWSLLEALVLGYELAARVGIASRLNPSMHPHGTWGTIGAAQAVAKLYNAGPSELVTTINIASSFGIATSRRTMLEGATVRNSYAGLSNQLGLLAWDMACAGFTGEADGVATVYDQVIATDFDAAAMLESLGNRWEIARNYFKMHAACRYTHAALDALGSILAGSKIDPKQISSIDVKTYSWAAQLDNRTPDNMLAAKFSIPFALATTVVNGAASVAAFRQISLRDPQIRDLAARVSVTEDAAMTAALPAGRPTSVTVHLADGRTLHAQATFNKGDVEDPYGSDAIVGKFRALTEPLWGASHVDRIIERVMVLDEAVECAELFSLLRAPPVSPTS